MRIFSLTIIFLVLPYPSLGFSCEKQVTVGLDLWDLRKYEESIDVYTKILESNNSCIRAFFERAMSLLELNRKEEALNDLATVIKINPNFHGVREHFSKLNYELGNYKLAAQVKLEELRANPDGPHEGLGVSPLEWSDTAKYLLKAGERKKAKQLLEEYFDNYQTRVNAYKSDITTPINLYANFLLQERDTANALKYAELAKIHSESVPRDHFFWIKALAYNGEVVKAKYELKNYLLIMNPDNGPWEVADRLAEEISNLQADKRKRGSND